MRYDAGSRAREATPQELRGEIARIEEQMRSRDAMIASCKREVQNDPGGPWFPRLAAFQDQQQRDAMNLHNLRYELKCSRSVDDSREDEWRPASSTYTYGDNG
jgi:hypothetical protein